MFNSTNLDNNLDNNLNNLNHNINNNLNNQLNTEINNLENIENIEINLFYNYMTFINNYINIVNHNIRYLNSTNDTLHNINNNLNYYYYNTLYRNNRRVRRRINEDYYNQETFYNQNVDDNVDDNVEENVNDNVDDNVEYNIESIDDSYYFNLSNTNIENIFDNNTTNMLYSEIANPLNSSCSITQEDFESNDDVCIINNCGHIFFKNALHNWYKRHYSCPNCRYNFLENTNLIRYTSRDNSSRLLLTHEQFRNFLANNIVNSFLNTYNRDSSGNNFSIFFATN
jgi:hypothetical protein